MKPDWLNDSSVTEVEVVAKGSYIRHIMVLQPIARGQVARTSHDTTAVSGEKDESRIRQSIKPNSYYMSKWGLPKWGNPYGNRASVVVRARENLVHGEGE